MLGGPAAELPRRLTLRGAFTQVRQAADAPLPESRMKRTALLLSWVFLAACSRGAPPAAQPAMQPATQPAAAGSSAPAPRAAPASASTTMAAAASVPPTE
ncbi:MAG TPA: hypothetical protein VLM17_02910, partial [Xanthomonadaceae bacterium]|nr:hypothetical protein [Xanthomonadaceae bacterium]